MNEVEIDRLIDEADAANEAAISEMEASEQEISAPVDAGEPVADPVEEAAEKFTKLLPFVSRIANSTPSKGSLVRVLHAFAEFPLGEGKPRLLNDSEKMLFNMLQELQGYKSTILQDFLKKNLAKMQEERKVNGESEEIVAENRDTP